MKNFSFKGEIITFFFALVNDSRRQVKFVIIYVVFFFSSAFPSFLISKLNHVDLTMLVRFRYSCSIQGETTRILYEL